MGLRERLASIQAQRVQPPREPGRSAGYHGQASVPLSARLQRLVSAQTDSPPIRPVVADELALLLGGEFCAEGVILIEHAIPLSQYHGCIGFNEISRVPLQFFAGGDEPPRDGLLFIDTETSGLAGGTGTIAFMIGLARIEEDEIRLRQYFLTSFKAEADMLAEALTWISSASHLVSFNGKCFDVPLLITRYRLSRMANPFADLAHIDLLHPTRTAFAKSWPDCRLQTAEQYLFRLYREDDLPGYLIPQVWAGYLRYGETRGARGIVEHNRVDLLSLIALVAVLARVYAEPGHRYADPLAIARAHRRSGSESAALLHLREQAEALSEQALLELAWLYARSSQWEEAVAIWQRLVGNGSLQAMERLAKFYEHTRRDYSAALAYSQALISRDSNSAAHQQRIARVRAKLAKLLNRDITFPDTAL
jgi:uncharacterized protein YprB with RNaseH-like and TPR domain